MVASAAVRDDLSALLRQAMERRASGMIRFDGRVAVMYFANGLLQHAEARSSFGTWARGDDALVAVVTTVLPMARTVAWIDLEAAPPRSTSWSTAEFLDALDRVVAQPATRATGPDPAVASADDTPPPPAARSQLGMVHRPEGDARPVVPDGVHWTGSDVLIFLASAIVAPFAWDWTGRHFGPVGFSLFGAAVYGGVSAWIVFTIRRRGSPFSAAGLRLPSPIWFLYALPIAVATVALAGFVAELQRGLLGLTASACGANGGVTPTVTVLAVGILVGPAAEELAFRGFVQSWLADRLVPALTIVVSAVVFGALHVIGEGAAAVLPITFVGGVLAVVYRQSGSVLPGMLIHATFNAMSLVNTVHSGC